MLIIRTRPSPHALRAAVVKGPASPWGLSHFRPTESRPGRQGDQREHQAGGVAPNAYGAFINERATFLFPYRKSDEDRP